MGLLNGRLHRSQGIAASRCTGYPRRMILSVSDISSIDSEMRSRLSLALDPASLTAAENEKRPHQGLGVAAAISAQLLILGMLRTPGEIGARRAVFIAQAKANARKKSYDRIYVDKLVDERRFSPRFATRAPVSAATSN